MDNVSIRKAIDNGSIKTREQLMRALRNNPNRNRLYEMYLSELPKVASKTTPKVAKSKSIRKEMEEKINEEDKETETEEETKEETSEEDTKEEQKEEPKKDEPKEDKDTSEDKEDPEPKETEDVDEDKKKGAGCKSKKTKKSNTVKKPLSKSKIKKSDDGYAIYLYRGAGVDLDKFVVHGVYDEYDAFDKLARELRAEGFDGYFVEEEFDGIEDDEDCLYTESGYLNYITNAKIYELANDPYSEREPDWIVKSRKAVKSVKPLIKRKKPLIKSKLRKNKDGISKRELSQTSLQISGRYAGSNGSYDQLYYDVTIYCPEYNFEKTYENAGFVDLDWNDIYYQCEEMFFEVAEEHLIDDETGYKIDPYYADISISHIGDCDDIGDLDTTLKELLEGIRVVSPDGYAPYITLEGYIEDGDILTPSYAHYYLFGDYLYLSDYVADEIIDDLKDARYSMSKSKRPITKRKGGKLRKNQCRYSAIGHEGVGEIDCDNDFDALVDRLYDMCEDEEIPDDFVKYILDNETGQKHSIFKSKRKLRKTSIAGRGSEQYNGRQKYQQIPMIRQALDREFTPNEHSDVIKNLNAKIEEMNKNRKSPFGNKVPKKL